MNITDEINKMIEGAISQGKERFVIYPYGVVGKKTKELLNHKFGIDEIAVVDDGLALPNENILKTDCFRKLSLDCVVLLSSINTYIYGNLYNNATQWFSRGNVFELPSMRIGESGNIEVREMENKYRSNKEKNMLVLFWIRDEDGDLGYYFTSRGKHKIAVWGVDELACQFAQLANKSDSIDFVGMFFNRELGCGLRYPSTVRTGAYIKRIDSPSEIKKIYPDIDTVIFFEDFKYISNNPEYVSATEIFGSDPYTGPLCGSVDQQSLKCFLKLVNEMGIKTITVSYPMGYEFDWFPLTRKRLQKESRKEWQFKENSFSDDKEYYDFQNEKLICVEANEKQEGFDYPPYKGKYFEFDRNSRKVSYDSECTCGRVIVGGPCMVSDVLHIQSKSFGSVFQKRLVDRGIKKTVETFVQKPNISRKICFMTAINELGLDSNDVFVWMDLSPKMSNPDINLYGLCQELYKECGEDFFMDVPYHMNSMGMTMVADIIIDKLDSSN